MGQNKPWTIEELSITAGADFDATTAVPLWGNHGSYEADWAGFTLDLTHSDAVIGSTIATATVRRDGTTVLRLFYLADTTTAYSVVRVLEYIDNLGNLTGETSELDQTWHGTSPDGTVHDDWGGTTDTSMTAVVITGDDVVVANDGHHVGVAVPAGYYFDADRTSQLVGIVKGDGTLVLYAYFRPVFEIDPHDPDNPKGASKYKIEHWTVDGRKVATLVESKEYGRRVAGSSATANPADLWDSSLFVGYGYTADPVESIDANGSVIWLTSNPHIDHIAGDGTTVLRLYYKALSRKVHFDLGTGGSWSADTPDAVKADRDVFTGSEIHLPASGYPQRAGYTFVGWSAKPDG